MQIWNFGDKIEEQSALLNSIGIKFKMILKLRDLKNVKVSNFFSKGFFFWGRGASARNEGHDDDESQRGSLS